MADPPPVLTVLIEKGPRKGKTLQHRAGAVLRVGRVVKGNDLAVGDAGASQRHLDLAFLPPPASRWAATDLGSSNGTLLNGAPLVPTIPAPLSHGDRIKIGESTVLAVSIAADGCPEHTAARRSTRHAAIEAVEEENKAPAVRRGRRKAPALADPPEVVEGEAEVATRRGGKKKAQEVADPLEAEKEQVAVVTRRGGRKKAAERAEAEREEEEEVLPSEPSMAPVTALHPPQSQTTRSRRAAARGAEVGTVEQTGRGRGRGRGRVTRQSARKAKEAIRDEDEDGEVAVSEEQKGATAKSVRENDDEVENGDRTSNASEVEVAIALREPPERTRKGRGRVRASTRMAKEPVIEEDAKKEGDGVVIGARDCRGNPPQVTAAKGGDEKEDEGTTGSEEVDGASKANQVVGEHSYSPLAPRGKTQKAPNGRADPHSVSVDKAEERKGSGRVEGSGIDRESRERMVPESKLGGVREADEDGKRGVTGGRVEDMGCENVSKCPGGCSLENMTLREWFARIEEYIRANNRMAAEKAIADVEEKHQRFADYIKTLN